MAKSIKFQREVYTLELSQSEALMLRAIMQNPLGEQETPEVTEVRESIFYALSEPQELNQ